MVDEVIVQINQSINQVDSLAMPPQSVTFDSIGGPCMPRRPVVSQSSPVQPIPFSFSFHRNIEVVFRKRGL